MAPDRSRQVPFLIGCAEAVGGYWDSAARLSGATGGGGGGPKDRGPEICVSFMANGAASYQPGETRWVLPQVSNRKRNRGLKARAIFRTHDNAQPTNILPSR